MRSLLLHLFMLFTAVPSFSQSVGIGTASPAVSALLEVNSTEKGMLVPRMNSTQRSAIASPAKGLLVFDNDTNSFWFYNGSAWTNLSGGGGEFVRQNNIVSNTTNTASDNFVFGSTALNDVAGSADDNRFFFNKTKGAFRAGRATTLNWNTDSLGIYSFAAGIDAKATGEFAVALGEATVASGHSSTAMGALTNASGWISTAMGAETKATANYATAMGFRTLASGDYSYASGSNATASGNYASTFGNSTRAAGINSFAAGLSTTASGNSATSFGAFSNASGLASAAIGLSASATADLSTAIGPGTYARSFSEISLGSFNTLHTVSAGGVTAWNATDRLFSVGNGTADNARSTAFSIFKNGRIGIGMDNPFVPLNFSPTLGDKISLWGNSNQHYGMGVQSGLLFIHSDVEGSDIAFGHGGNTSFSEKMRIRGNGNVGIGTDLPTNTLDVDGTVRIRGGNPGAGKVLTSSANGTASWVSPATPPAAPPRPYVIVYPQTEAIELTGTQIDRMIPGMDQQQFTLTHPATVVFFLKMNFSTSTLGLPLAHAAIELFHVTGNYMVGALYMSYKFTDDVPGKYVSGQSVAVNLPAGTYGVWARCSRSTTSQGNLYSYIGARDANKLILQVFPQ